MHILLVGWLSLAAHAIGTALAPSPAVAHTGIAFQIGVAVANGTPLPVLGVGQEGFKIGVPVANVATLRIEAHTVLLLAPPDFSRKVNGFVNHRFLNRQRLLLEVLMRISLLGRRTRNISVDFVHLTNAVVYYSMLALFFLVVGFLFPTGPRCEREAFLSSFVVLLLLHVG